MRQFQNLGDERLLLCVYCADRIDDRDHVPSKVLLDEPYPENLPVVPSCRKCNESFSLDEEYIACLVECARHGEVNETSVEREKVRRILRRKPILKMMLLNAQKSADESVFFTPQNSRVERVILKLARGHVAFELGSPQLGTPIHIAHTPLCTLNEQQLTNYETLPRSILYPEVGSRGMQRLFTSDEYHDGGWITVQEGRYRFGTWIDSTIGIRIVLSEYLACEVVWGR